MVMNKIDIQRYLGQFDIDPDRVKVSGIGPQGYLRTRRADSGQAIYEPGTRTFATEFMPWPDGFDYETLQRLIDGGSLEEHPSARKATAKDLGVERQEPAPKVEPKTKAETPKKAGK